MKKILLLSLFVSQVFAEQVKEATPLANMPSLPGSEVWLFEIQESAAGELTLSSGKNISNHPGYDSQPRFSQDGQVLYYTREVLVSGKSQTDIYEYHLATQKTMPYMTTAESEYSASVDYQEPGITVVQVDAQGDQYVVHMNKEAAEEANKVNRYSDLKQVGYFGWTSGYKFWSFVLNDAGGGDLVHMGKSKKPKELEKNIGRTLVTNQSKELIYYVDKNATPWRIKSRQRKLHPSVDIMELPPAVEDFTVDAKGRFWAGKDDVLFVSKDHKSWIPVKNFSSEKLTGISRLTTNPDASLIAIVFAEKQNSE